MRRLLELRASLRILCTAAIVMLLATCASGPRVVNHSFEFDARRDSPDIEILEYRYGTSNHPAARSCPNRHSPCTAIPQYTGVTGDMFQGDDLYVKWRIKSTGDVYEDLVDLRGRLPANMENQRIRFVVNRSQLYVFVIRLNAKINPNPCPNDEERLRLDYSSIPFDKIFSIYCSRKIIQIYPNKSTNQQSK